MSNRDRKGLLVVLGLLWSGLAGAANHRLTLNEEIRLSAPISKQSLNRIVVVGDRIQNIFGDEGAFSLQSDEQSGQVFIKPSLENQDKPLVLTVVTENGLTQDLDLVPTALEASTLILKPPSSLSPTPERVGAALESQSLMQRWIETLRQAALGSLALQDKARPSLRSHKGLVLTYQRSYSADDLKVEVWQLKNKTGHLQELCEKDFYVKGDIALSLGKKLLAGHEHTSLYILGRNHV